MRKFALFSFVYLLLSAIFLSYSSHAATFNVPAGDVQALINAILSANTNKDASNTINLAKNSVYELKTAYTADYKARDGKMLGAIGLPAITKNLTINGNGAVIKRLSSAPQFRIFVAEIHMSITINNLTIEGGDVVGEGGGMYKNTGGTLSLRNVKFINNRADGHRGGGINIQSRNTSIIEDCEFRGNKVKNIGGGLFSVLADLTVINTKFIENECFNTSITEDTKGGGLYVDGALGGKGKIEVRKSLFHKNTAHFQGGGSHIYLYNSDEAIVDQCDFSENVLKGKSGSAFGGGLILFGGAHPNGVLAIKATVTNCLFYKNISASQGGGIWAMRGQHILENNTFLANEAKLGGAYMATSGSISFKNCTIAENKASNGTGGINTGTSATLSLSNNIFFNNVGTSGRHHANTGVAITDLGNNIQFKTGDADKSLPLSIRVANPLLLPLADNGGPTRTMALQKGSPAIDAGNNCTPTDQRGQKRVGKCDIGAFEYVPNTSADFTPTSPQNITTGQSITFQDASTNNPTAWEWTITGGTFTFINGTNKNSQNPQVRFDSQGVFSVALTASNVSGSDTKTVANFITVTSPLPKPIADFTPNTFQEITVGQHIKFYDRSKNNPTSWQWTVTGGKHQYIWNNTSTSKDPRIQFDEAGLYTISVTVSNAAGSHTKTVTQMVKVNHIAPIADFTPNTFQEITVGQHIKFYDRSKNNPTSWQWTVTGGKHRYIWNNTSTSKDPRIQFDEAGLYTISVTVSNAAGSHTKTVTQMVKVNPVIVTQQNTITSTNVILSEPNIHAPTNLQATINSANEVTLEWKDISTDQEGYKIYRKEEEKEPILIQTINKANLETLSFNDQSKLNPDTQYNYYIVTFGKNVEKQSNLATIHTYPAKPQLDKIEYQCVNNKYTIKINSLNPTTRYRKLHQSEEVVKTQLIEQDFFQIEASRDSKIKIVAIGKTGLESMPLEIELEKREQPQAQIIGETERKICATHTLLTALKVENASYEWRLNGKVIEDFKGSEIKVSQSGKYELVIKQNGCEFISNPVEISFFALKTPQIDASSEVKFCKKGQLTIKEAQKEVKYQWLDEQGRVVGEGTSLSVEKTGIYKVIAISDLGCQEASTSVKVNVGQPILLNTQIMQPTCFNNDNGKIVIASQDKQNIRIKLGEQVKEGSTVSFEHLKAGIYNIIAETAYGCYKEIQVEIRNPEKFQVKISESELTTNKFTAVQLQAEGAVEYEWFPKEGLDNPYIANPKANPSQTTTYKVVGKNKNGCESSAEIKVNLIDTEEILPSKILSPNGDGVNDTWQIENIEFFPDAEVIVYNRFGQEVFHTIGYQNNWDGSINVRENAPSPSTFYFVIKIPQINKYMSGSLTIMR